MAEHTKIQWADGTVNPVMGCCGCELWNRRRRSCYAGILHRIRGGTNPGFAVSFDRPMPFPGRMAKAARQRDLSGTRRPRKPWLDGQPRMIFTSDMGDALSKGISFDYLESEIIGAAVSPAGRRHRWLWVTKRPERMGEFSAWLEDWDTLWPENLWAGTTITTQGTTSRLEALAKVGNDKTIRFASVEPQLEELDLERYLPGLDWVIQGGESGADPRPFDTRWARKLRDECRAAGVAYFLKQLGAHALDEGEPLALHDGHGGDWDEWAKDLRVREVPVTVLQST